MGNADINSLSQVRNDATALEIKPRFSNHPITIPALNQWATSPARDAMNSI